MGKKNEAVRLRFIAPQVRFMAQRAASYGASVLHKRLTMKHCSAKAPQYETSPLPLRYEALRFRGRNMKYFKTGKISLNL